MTTNDSISPRHRRIAERLGYHQDGKLPSMWRHDEQPTRLFGWGLVMLDVQREIDRCMPAYHQGMTYDDCTIDDHVFPDDCGMRAGDRCCCDDVELVDDGTGRMARRWTL